MLGGPVDHGPLVVPRPWRLAGWKPAERPFHVGRRG